MKILRFPAIALLTLNASAKFLLKVKSRKIFLILCFGKTAQSRPRICILSCLANGVEFADIFTV
jgi:hypothetical protein